MKVNADNGRNPNLDYSKYAAPCKVDYPLNDDKLPEYIKNNKNRYKKCGIWFFKDKYYSFNEICSHFNMSSSIVYKRLKRGWNIVDAFCIESHRNDYYIQK
jgi:hypothetical protein